MPAAAHELRRVEQVMGTAVTVTVPGGCAPAVLDEVFAWWHWVDRTFSVHRPDSQVSLVSAGSLAPGKAHPLVDEVLDRCAGLFLATDGWFDAWPDGPLGRVDPSGFVKGWSVDIAATLLRGAAVDDYCIAAGGDVKVAGCSDQSRPWRIGVQHPLENRAVAAVLRATELAVATSGAYERGSHVWGRADADGLLLSATVVGPRLGTADALATALFAADGRAEGWFQRFAGYDYLTIGTDRRVRWTPGLDRFLVSADPCVGTLAS
jgi:thiamine biosynthesis lipoprotein